MVRAVVVFAFLSATTAGILAMATAASAPPLPTALELPTLVPTADQGAVASAVARTLVTQHYGKGAIDDARSRLWLDRYIDDLDPQKLYFVRKDIDEFESRWAATLDDDVLAASPRLEAAYAIHARYRQRVSERVDAIQQLLDEPYPLDDPEASVELDREDAPWASSPAELDPIWRGRIAEQVLSMRIGDERAEDPIVRLKKRYERVRREAFDVDVEDVLELYLSALSTTFDPHSIWFKPVSKENFDIDMQDTLIGIGAVLQSKDGYTIIKELVVGGPAEQSGLLRPNDTILAVAQGDAASADVVEMRIDRVVQLIRGKEGTPVVLTIHPANATDPSETKEVRLIREKVKLSQAASKGEVRTLDLPSGHLRVGVIDVPSFYEDGEGERAGDPNAGSTAGDVERLLTAWKTSDPVDAVVIDLRMNGGGSLDQALKLTGLFLDGGPVVQVRSREGEIEVLRDPSRDVAWAGPLVVLTSEFSASASEIFAAALQDYGRALIVGSETTHGKGTVQNLIGLERYLMRTGNLSAAQRAGAIKFTTHMFYRINGESTQLHGVHADVRVPSPFEGIDMRESDLDFALAWDAIPEAPHRQRRWTFDLGTLQAASDARVARSQEFAWMKEDVAQRAEIEDMKTLSLYLPGRRDELAQDKAAAESRKAARVAAGAKLDGDGEPEVDPVLDEALAVTADFVGVVGTR
ncbi:MAG TPA: carboxy terminal-processing peptidase [Myxococcota bacterium]|nr:carboxy terminal-processing peptidase [Myxococcota bacterium]